MLTKTQAKSARLTCDYCDRQATHRMVMVDAMKAKIGQARAHLLCKGHSKISRDNYKVSALD